MGHLTVTIEGHYMINPCQVCHLGQGLYLSISHVPLVFLTSSFSLSLVAVWSMYIISPHLFHCFWKAQKTNKKNEQMKFGHLRLWFTLVCRLSLSRRWASCWCCKVFHWCECVQKGRLLFHKLIPVALVKFKSWETRLPGLPAGVRVPSAKRPEKYQTNSFADFIIIIISKITTKVRALSFSWLFLVHFLLGIFMVWCVGILFKIYTTF